MVEIDMAIVIPSSKIYEMQNPKVRDNVIERIEVGAVEVVPDNEYETPVYNQSFLNGLQSVTESHTGELGFDFNGVTGARAFSWALISSSQSFFTVDLSIPKVINNKYISKIFNKIKENGENWIGVNVAYEKNTGKATAEVTDILYGQTYDMVSYSLGEIIKGSPTKTETIVGNIPNAETTYSHIANQAPVGSQSIATSTIKFEQESNLNSISYDDSDPNYIKLNGLKILSSSKTTKLGYGHSAQLGAPNSITLEGNYVDYNAVSIEITIYGNTIGIDLTDKTVYINGETQKKVHSVDGNELMQTRNYLSIPQKLQYGGQRTESENTRVIKINILENNFIPFTKFIYNGEVATVMSKNEPEKYYIIEVKKGGEFDNLKILQEYEFFGIIENAINKKFLDTQSDYAKGKETATIRCSIGDYFDYKSGEKIISIDNSTGEMSFKMYDQVIPMVYGANEQDQPMSTYQDGSPKIFQVLGTKIYYDGAVWQELSLQEV